METEYTGNNGGIEKEVKVANRRTVGTCESLLRILALVLTLAAAVVVGVDKQTKVAPIKLLPTLPPINIPVTAKWHYLSAFVYLAVANAIACTYAAFSLVLSLATRGTKKSSGPMIIIFLDLLVVALLFSSNGAALAIGLMGYQGNSHVQWNKVCDVFGKFCNQVAASVLLSLLGSLAFFFLVVLAVSGLNKRSNNK